MIRMDYIHDRAVIIAPGRRKRPHQFHQETLPPPPPAETCVFCPRNLRGVASLGRVGPRRAWRANVIRNVFPIVSYDNPRAFGTQEVVIETPHHNVELAELPVRHIAELLHLYGQRTTALSRNRRIGYVLIFKNQGGRAGASIAHAHSQIFASEFIPPHIRTKLIRAQEYRITHGQCYYCHLMDDERGGPRWITENREVVAFTPYASSYNYEVWVMPKRDIDNVAQLSDRERASLARVLKRLLVRLQSLGLPYNYYLHQNVRDREEHLYLRLCPRRDVWAGIELGSRMIVNTVPPEEAAAFYRRR